MSNNDTELSIEPSTSSENGLANSDAIEYQPLLSADEYKKRIEAAQSSIHKSLLILLALLAFLLAIENSYSRFTELFDQFVSLEQVNTNAEKVKALIRTARAEKAHAQAAITASAEAKDSSYIIRADVASKLISEYETRLETKKKVGLKIEENILQLKKESVDLSIAGTKLPSQLSFAPTIWLMTMFCWLLYFNSRRASAHRSLAALHLALNKNQRSFGAAGDGSMWIVPLPQIVRLSPTRGDTCVLKEDLLWLLGWSRLSERRFQLGLFVFVLITQLILLRVVFIAYEMTGDFAIQRNFSPQLWQFSGTVIPVFMAIICSFQLLRLPFTPRDSEHLQASAVATRREFLGGIFGLALAVTAWKYRNAIVASANRQGLVSFDPASRAAALKNPRYISPQGRAKRLSQYRVVIPVTQKVALLYSVRKRLPALGHHPRVVTLHYANKDGKVRLFSTARTLRFMTALSVAEADSWVKKTQKLPLSSARHTTQLDLKTLPLNTKRTWVWEALALDRVESSDVEGACGHLIVGAELALLAPLAEPMNLRLLDLLAGLAIRAGHKGQQYLTPLEALVHERIDRLRKEGAAQGSQPVMEEDVFGRHSRSIATRPRDKLPTPSPSVPSPAGAADHDVRRNPGRSNDLNAFAEQLNRRLEKWKNQDSNWHKHWSDKTRPIWWHHPMETRQFESHRHVKSQGEQKTETRQRPVRIA
jgi:hypothetical protein